MNIILILSVLRQGLALFLICFSIILIDLIDPVMGGPSRVCFAGEICQSGFQPDCDVDGADLASLVSDFNQTDTSLASFAADYGRTDCPRIELKHIDAPDLELAGVLQLEDEIPKSSYWKPKAEVLDGFQPLAHCGLTEIPSDLYHMPEVRKHLLVARDLYPEAEMPALKPPASYTQLWQAMPPGTGLTFICYRPVPPPGYACLGDIVTLGGVDPASAGIKCVLESLTRSGRLGHLIHFGANPDFPAGGFNTWRINANNGVWSGSYSAEGISVNAFRGYYGPVDPTTFEQYVLDNRCVLSRAVLLPSQINFIMNTHAPVFQFHSQELYGPDHPKAILEDTGSKLEWGVIEPVLENNYDYFAYLFVKGPYNCDVTSDDLIQKVRDNVMTDDDSGEPGFRYYIRFPEYPQLTGNYANARAFVHVRLRDHVFTELQYWMWYPFNGPGRAHVTVDVAGVEWYDNYYQLQENGRHYGDGESVTLTFLTETMELKYVEMSRHHTSQFFAQHQGWAGFLGYNGLQFLSLSHPLVYVAKYSHAHYPAAGFAEYNYILTEPSQGIKVRTYPYDLCDANGVTFLSQEKLEVVASHYPGYPVKEPDWLNFQGRWGQYIRSMDTFDYPVYSHDQKEVQSGTRGMTTNFLW
jgi:hypothetical protein